MHGCSRISKPNMVQPKLHSQKMDFAEPLDSTALPPPMTQWACGSTTRERRANPWVPQAPARSDLHVHPHRPFHGVVRRAHAPVTGIVTAVDPDRPEGGERMGEGRAPQGSSREGLSGNASHNRRSFCGTRIGY